MRGKKVARYLQSKRKKLNLNQSEVAEQLGYSAQVVSNWERGLCLPPKKCLKKLVQIYRVPRSEFCDLLIQEYSSEVKKLLK